MMIVNFKSYKNKKTTLSLGVVSRNNTSVSRVIDINNTIRSCKHEDVVCERAKKSASLISW